MEHLKKKLYKLKILLSKVENDNALSINFLLNLRCITEKISIKHVDVIWWITLSWWRHQMETFSALLAICVGNSPVTGEFPSQRPVMQSFDVFFLRLNKRLSKQSWGWWFEMPSLSLWRHCNGYQDCACCWHNILQWRPNEHDGISNHQHLDCLLNCLLRCR